MFYEEKIIDGMLCCRTSPDGEWRAATGVRAKAANALLAMTSEQRLDLLSLFCLHCGGVQRRDPVCHCYNAS